MSLHLGFLAGQFLTLQFQAEADVMLEDDRETLLRITDVTGEKRKSPRIKAAGSLKVTSCCCKNAFQKRESLAPASPADMDSAGTRR